MTDRRLSRLSPETAALALKLARTYLNKSFRTDRGIIRGRNAYSRFQRAMLAEGFDDGDVYMLAAIMNDMGSITGVSNLLKYFAAPKDSNDDECSLPN